MAKTTAPARRFSGFTSPHYTQVPDELFDALMVTLSGAELKVLLYIIRRTFGFKRDSDSISLSQMLGGLKASDGQQLDHGVGISKRSLLAALRTLAERGVILTERRSSAARGNEPTSYRLNIRTGTPQQEQEALPPPLVQKLSQGGGAKTAPSPREKTTPHKKQKERQILQIFERLRPRLTALRPRQASSWCHHPPQPRQRQPQQHPQAPRRHHPAAVHRRRSRRPWAGSSSSCNRLSRRPGRRWPPTSPSSPPS